MRNFEMSVSVVCPSETELLDMKGDFRCTVENCQSIFKKLPNLRMHLSKHHRIGVLGVGDFTNAKFFCPISSCVYNVNSEKLKSFSQRRLLKQHYQKVHAAKQYACEKCNSKFSILAMFKRHAKSCGKEFVCGVCGWKYNSNESFMVHLLRKHPDVHKQHLKSKNPNTSKILVSKTNNQNVDYNTQSNEISNNRKDLDSSVESVSVSYDTPVNIIICENLTVLHCDRNDQIDLQTSSSSETNLQTQPLLVLPSKQQVLARPTVDTTSTSANSISKSPVTTSDPVSFSINQDRFTQTIAKTVKKSSHTNTEKFNVQTQTFSFGHVSRHTGNISLDELNTYKNCGKDLTSQELMNCQEEPAIINTELSKYNANSINLQKYQGKLSEENGNVTENDFKHGTDVSNSYMSYKSNEQLQQPMCTNVGETNSSRATYSNQTSPTSSKSENSAKFIYQDSSCNKCPGNFANIETQTALDELLYSNLSSSFSDDTSLFSELISFSDIQTQTAWASEYWME